MGLDQTRLYISQQEAVCRGRGPTGDDLYHNCCSSDADILQVIEKKIELGQQKRQRPLSVTQKLYGRSITLRLRRHLASRCHF